MEGNKVSIIVGMYNSERYIRRTLKSLVEQSYENIEIIVIDDGSTDNGSSLVEEISQNDLRVKMYKKKNGGLSSARNLGLEKSSGNFVMFVDSDDYVDKDAVNIMVQLIDNNNADLVVSGIYIDYETNELKLITSNKIEIQNKCLTDKLEIAHESFFLKKRGIIDSCCNKIYRKSIIDEHDLKMPVGEKYEDTDFNFRYLKYVNSFVMTNECYYHYMQRKTARLTNTYNENKYLDLEKRIFTMKEYAESVGAVNDYGYISYWYARYIYSTMIDINERKLDYLEWIKKIYARPLYLELSSAEISYPNVFMKMYANSILKKKKVSIFLITKLSSYLKRKRNDKK